MSIDEIIEEAIRRELALADFYREAAHSVGPDAQSLLQQISDQQIGRIGALQKLAAEITELRDLNEAIAD